jgi:hypothetical protein
MSDDGNPSATNDLVVIWRYSTAPEAFVAAYHLDSEGIDSTIEDQELTTIDWELGQGAGGVKVLVQREDAERAQAVLRNATEKESAAEADSSYGQGRAIVRRASRTLLLGVVGFPPALVYALVLFHRAERLDREGHLDGPLRRRIIIMKIALWFFMSFYFIAFAGLVWLKTWGD